MHPEGLGVAWAPYTALLIESRRLRRVGRPQKSKYGLGLKHCWAPFSSMRVDLGNRATVRPGECSQLCLHMLGSSGRFELGSGAASHQVPRGSEFHFSIFELSHFDDKSAVLS